MDKEIYDDLFKQFEDSLKRVWDEIFFNGRNEGLKQLNKEKENLDILYDQYKKEIINNGQK